MAAIQSRSACVLGDRVASIGRTTNPGEDEAWTLPDMQTAARMREERSARRFVTGEVVRDFVINGTMVVRDPYAGDHHDAVVTDDHWLPNRGLWASRTLLRARTLFGRSMEDAGRAWYEHLENYPRRLSGNLSISYAEVATHNHFVLDRGGKLFKQTAPVVKLPEGAREDDYLEVLGLLNSSTICFWLKQKCQDKGNRGGERSTGRFAWENYYQFSGSKVEKLPLSEEFPLVLSRMLDALAGGLVAVAPTVGSDSSVPTRGDLAAARGVYTEKRGRMVALQEELDWQVYGLYGLLSDEEILDTAAPEVKWISVPGVELGERAFEIALARSALEDEGVQQWFERHGATPVTDIPDRWPDWYRDIVQARIDLIESRKDIALIERPEYKRRWSSEPWEKKEKAALRTWLLDRIEEPSLWFGLRDGTKQPRALTVSQLADVLRDDADFNSVAQLYATDHMGKPDIPLADVLAEIVADEHVPYLAALRYKDSGLRKREQWEQVWELQREEDRTGERLDIPVPPKYKGADFQKQSYWSNRGKLDVPKERFISYLEASPDADPTILLGWAGWDHKDQAQALFNLIDDRTRDAGWGTDRIKPLLAGVLEVMPWVRQWHGEYDEEWEGVPADEYQAYFEELCAKHQVSEADLRAWRPEKRTRSRKKAAAKKADAEQPALDSE
ncbi:BREX-2 system adenine-specific DNA-methyltransferase PglX [Streptomyces demainii]|uniref:BREX-2 system adenine-specific DNA-methyltransferase PglX n=1 Tax=Streptomyces demainii TaxID=588122 RepID=UPI0027D86E0A|nr:BREX-2 system adenine-specific DNA-methyltransferase PglX [Streptomyces demainii]